MPFRKWLTDVLTTPGAPRCNQSSTQPPGSAPGRGQRASAAQDHRSSPAGRRPPRCLSLQPGRVQPGQADAAAESLALSLSLSCSSQPGSLVSGGSTGGLLPHHLAPQADSSFCSAPLSLLLCFLYLSSVALHPPPWAPTPLYPLGSTHNPPALCHPDPWNNRPPGPECPGPWVSRVKDDIAKKPKKPEWFSY